MNQQMLTAREAAAELGVSRATLYAYVSRGLIASEPAATGRHNLYRAEDVRRLRLRKTPSDSRESAARKALSSSKDETGDIALFDSAITLIRDGAFYYRGRDAVSLARTSTLETVATLLWDQGETDPFSCIAPAIDGPRSGLPEAISGMARAQALLSLAAETDLQGLNLAPDGVARTGAGILRMVIAAFLDQPVSDAPAADQCARAWGIDAGHDHLIRQALILSADHELNPSTFVARCVASTRTTPYAAVIAGLSAMQGARHGGWTARVSALFSEASSSAGPEATVIARLKRGDEIPGFGHKLYPDGDPRFKSLFSTLQSTLPGNEAVDLTDRLVRQTRELTGRHPNIDVALVALQRTLALPEEASLALFTIGRTVGWIAHIMEQYAHPELIRPRARYVGEPPSVPPRDGPD